MAEPTCATCPAGVLQHDTLVECRLGPAPRRKKSADWCAQHPARQRDRVDQRALQGILAARPQLALELAARRAYRAADALEAARVVVGEEQLEGLKPFDLSDPLSTPAAAGGSRA